MAGSASAAGSQSPLRILHADFSANWGGQEFRVIEQLQWLAAAGHTVALACRPGADIALVAALRSVPAHSLSLRGVYNPLNAWRARTLLRRDGWQIVDCHGLREAVAFAPARAGRVVVRSQHVTGMIKGSLRHRLLWRLGCDHIVATAGRIRDELVAIAGVDEEHVSVIGEWAAPEFFRIADKPRYRAEVRAEFGLTPDRRLIVNVGMMRHDKGQEFLLDALARLREAGGDAIALLVGASTAQSATQADNYESMLRRRVAALGLSDRVIFTGYRRDVARLVQAADVQVVASVAVEGQSRTVPQAFAAEIPVVATTVGGLPELVVDGRTGILVPLRDGDAIARALAVVLGDDHACAAMVAEARRFAVAHLSIDAKMTETVAIYRRLLARRSPDGRCASLAPEASERR